MGTHRRTDDRGFTLIELLAVMVIIGLLATIAIPVFLGQRAKASAAASESDLSTVGRHLGMYYVTRSPTDPVPAVVVSSGAMMTVAGEDLGIASEGSQLLSVTGTGALDWCVAVANTEAPAPNVWAYSAMQGMRGPLGADPC